MSGCRRIEIYEPSLFIRETSIFKPKTPFFSSFPDEDELGFALDLLNPTLNPFAHYLPPQCFLPPPLPTSSSSSQSHHCDFFDSVTDLIQIEKSPFTSTTYKRVQERKGTDSSSYLKTLCDRVSALETGVERVAKAKQAKKKKKEELDRKYTWTTEIKSHEKDVADRKYKWIAEIKAGGEVGAKNYKWIAEIKGKGKDADASRTYTFKASTAPPSPATTKESCKSVAAAAAAKKDDKKKKPTKHVVEIEEEEEEPVDHGAVVLKQAFARRAAAAGNNGKGKKKELSPQDAAMMIQMTFRAYLIRRSQALRALRELAVAKAKLKELRGLFNNFSYRRRILRDGEERQKFSERIIVLLLTVDAIEGADIMVRSARRSMIDELEAMLEVVDPQPSGKLGSMKRRTFDLPECGIQKEIAAGVAEVVHMLDQEERNGGTFEKNI